MNNRQVAHEWANMSARDHSGSNFYHRGPRLYSYGSHYLLGNLFPVTPAGNMALINSRGYSVTTAKHTSYARAALSSAWRVIDVPDPEGDAQAHEENLAAMRTRAQELVDKMSRARNLYPLLDAHASLIEDYAAYTRAFNVKKAPKPANITEKRREAYAAKGREYIRNAQARTEARRVRLAAAEAKGLAEWRQGKNNGAYYSSAVALRISKDGTQLETSRGARVDLEAARTLYHAWKAGKNIIGRHIGSFTIDTIDGSIFKIGCHEVPIAEIEAIFAS